MTRVEDATDASAFFERPADLWLIHEAAHPAALRLVSRLRGRARQAGVPILFVAADDNEDTVLAAYEAGASTVLTPPLSSTQLIVRTTRLLRADRPPASSPKSHLTPGTIWHDRYEVQGMLGRGGSSVVYRALDRETREAVALKVAHRATWDDDSRERTAREAKSLAAVTCPQSPRLRRFSHCKGHDYMVLELIPGPTVFDWVQHKGPLSVEEGVDLLLGLSLALYSLSHHGLVHRDLKPANVVLRDGDPAKPVLVDFGLARAPDQDLLTDPDMLVGTIGYMAPEYVRGEPLGPQADLFSLGHLVRYALTGKQAYPELYGFDLLQALSLETAPIPSTIPEPLASLLQRLIDVEPEQRPSGPAELLQILASSAARTRKWPIGE